MDHSFRSSKPSPRLPLSTVTSCFDERVSRPAKPLDEAYSNELAFPRQIGAASWLHEKGEERAKETPPGFRSMAPAP